MRRLNPSNPTKLKVIRLTYLLWRIETEIDNLFVNYSYVFCPSLCLSIFLCPIASFQSITFQSPRLSVISSVSLFLSDVFLIFYNKTILRVREKIYWKWRGSLVSCEVKKKFPNICQQTNFVIFSGLKKIDFYILLFSEETLISGSGSGTEF